MHLCTITSQLPNNFAHCFETYYECFDAGIAVVGVFLGESSAQATDAATATRMCVVFVFVNCST